MFPYLISILFSRFSLYPDLISLLVSDSSRCSECLMSWVLISWSLDLLTSWDLTESPTYPVFFFLKMWYTEWCLILLYSLFPPSYHLSLLHSFICFLCVTARTLHTSKSYAYLKLWLHIYQTDKPRSSVLQVFPWCSYSCIIHFDSTHINAWFRRKTRR